MRIWEVLRLAAKCSIITIDYAVQLSIHDLEGSVV